MFKISIDMPDMTKPFLVITILISIWLAYDVSYLISFISLTSYRIRELDHRTVSNIAIDLDIISS